MGIRYLKDTLTFRELTRIQIWQVKDISILKPKCKFMLETLNGTYYTRSKKLLAEIRHLNDLKQ